MAISSPGIGSGLDVKSIISQLMALEQKPLEKLTTAATSYQTKLSAFGQLKSQLANLQDQASNLSKADNWDNLAFSSSNSAAVSGSIDVTTAQATSFSVQVSQLAQAQAAASTPFTANKTFGAGQLSIDLGSWTGNSFAPGDNAAINVAVSEGDTLSTVADKINATDAGVTATVLRDASGERLILKSDDTGKDAAFRVQSSGSSTLADLTYNPAVANVGMTRSQEALNTLATVNGVSVSSTDGTLKDAVPGVTLNFLQVTTAPVTISVSQDKAGIKANINKLVQSFNALSGALREMTKYDAGTQNAGSLQGDSTAVGLKNVLTRLFTGQGPASSSFKHLSDMGIALQLDGTLAVDDVKLTKALDNPTELQEFFTSASNGLATRVAAFAQGALSNSGSVGSRYQSLKDTIARNTKEQDRLSDRLEQTERRLTAQYSRLDSTLGKMSALGAYVSQQVTSWNNQNNN